MVSEMEEITWTSMGLELENDQTGFMQVNTANHPSSHMFVTKSRVLSRAQRTILPELRQKTRTQQPGIASNQAIGDHPLLQ